MATVTSFEGLPHPTRSELRQFAELFMPLFSASSDEARRQAVAALSQSKTVPGPVAFFIGSQPIAIAAPFLMTSTCLSDEALVAIARCQGTEHARAIVRREALSPAVIDALVGIRPEAARQARNGAAETPVAAEEAAIDVGPQDPERLAREEDLRRRIKLLAGHMERMPGDRLGLRSLTPVQEALLIRFARNREADFIVSLLSDILTASRWLAERILLDLSGRQLATVLKGLGLNLSDAVYVLTRLYGHLAETEDGISEAEALWQSLDENACGERVEGWRRADRQTHPQPAFATTSPEAYPSLTSSLASSLAPSPAASVAEEQASGDDLYRDQDYWQDLEGIELHDRPHRTSATIRRRVSGSRMR
ncbi:hypothetical protein NCHU2750_07770 [Neorhizobium sp. NCHU2750]|nr:hypothetical protein NCHU2750_07770 [Neorhizobium sp. NCHU2750]